MELVGRVVKLKPSSEVNTRSFPDLHNPQLIDILGTEVELCEYDPSDCTYKDVNGWWLHKSWFDKESIENTTETATSSALNIQEGGQHYKNLKIQPVEFIHANNIPYLEGNVIKYIVRHKNKNKLEDLKKAKHYIDMIIEMEYGEQSK